LGSSMRAFYFVSSNCFQDGDVCSLCSVQFRRICAYVIRQQLPKIFVVKEFLRSGSFEINCTTFLYWCECSVQIRSGLYLSNPARTVAICKIRYRDAITARLHIRLTVLRSKNSSAGGISTGSRKQRINRRTKRDQHADFSLTTVTY